jgi:FkbM family methyltransferase
MRLDLDDYVQRRIFYESHEPEQLAFFRRFLRRGDVVLDVGAHVGLFTLVSALEVGPVGEVHAFEPVPANFAALEANVELNGFENIVLNRAAVGAENGEVELGIPDDALALGGETSAMYTVGGGARTVSAPLIRLDDYVGALGDREIRILKMDAEGLEPSVLEGFRDRLQHAPPAAIVLEVNVELLDRHGFTGPELISELRSYGYELYRPTVRGVPKPHEPDLPVEFDAGRDLPEESPRGLGGWLRRYRAESRIFANVFAIQPRAIA